MRFDGLPVLVLQQIRERALKRAGRSTGESRRVAAGFDTVAGRLVPDQPHAGIVDERVEDADRVRPATHARRHRVRQPARLIDDLHPRFQPDHPLEVAHHRRERMRASRGAEAVVGVVGVGDPVSERLVDRILERLRAGLDRHHLRAKQPHARHVQACRAVSIAPM